VRGDGASPPVAIAAAVDVVAVTLSV